MKTTMKFLILVCVSLTITMTSCTKDGEIGPAGPAGINGTNGTDGTNGQDGNANVVSVLLENQTIENGNTVFIIPELTQNVFDTGIVYGYATVPGNEYWEVLPLSLGQDIILEIDKIEVGQITLRANFTQSNIRLRFVLVEGNLSSFLGDKTIETMTYGEAMNFFGLED